MSAIVKINKNLVSFNNNFIYYNADSRYKFVILPKILNSIIMVVYQVITVVDGVCHHEGFYDNEFSARNVRDSLSERMYYGDAEGDVVVTEVVL